MSRRPKKDTGLTDDEYEALMAECRRPKSPEEKRFIKLGWNIIEAKFQYYILDDPQLSDAEYDRMEREYIEIGTRLGKDMDALYMVDFDRSRPSCQLAADKMQGRNPPVDPDTLRGKA